MPRVSPGESEMATATAPAPVTATTATGAKKAAAAVRLPEANRLQGGNSFRDSARVLRMTRYMVGWASTGVQRGAFEATL
jgi:alkylation response protein AidB-like acyl-CoA dehydrogenase